MRVLFVYFLCLGATLTGCVNYSGVEKNKWRPWHATHLSTPHTYCTAKTKMPATAHVDWWARFNNPQLNALIDIALTDSPNMHTAAARLRAAQQVAASTEALLWPYTDMSGYRQRQRFSKTGLIPPPFNGLTFNIAELGLNFNYEFDFWGKNKQLLAASVSAAYAAEADVAAARLIVAASVAQVYFQLQSNLAALRIARTSVQQQQELLKITQTRIQHHIESDLPLQAAIHNAQNAKLSEMELQQTIAALQHQLAVLLGKNPENTTFHLEELNFKHTVITIPASLPANLLAHRPDIIASRLRAEAAAHQINVAKARFFPNINLNGLFSYQSIHPSLLFKHSNQNNAATLAFDLPIFDAGARRANLGLRYAEYDEAVSTYNQTILVALRDVTDQLATLRVLDKELETQRQNLAATRRNQSLIHAQFQHGIVGYAQVLNAQELCLQQQAKHIQLQTRYLQALVALIAALGGCYIN